MNDLYLYKYIHIHIWHYSETSMLLLTFVGLYNVKHGIYIISHSVTYKASMLFDVVSYKL